MQLQQSVEVTSQEEPKAWANRSNSEPSSENSSSKRDRRADNTEIQRPLIQTSISPSLEEKRPAVGGGKRSRNQVETNASVESLISSRSVPEAASLLIYFADCRGADQYFAPTRKDSLHCDHYPTNIIYLGCLSACTRLRASEQLKSTYLLAHPFDSCSSPSARHSFSTAALLLHYLKQLRDCLQAAAVTEAKIAAPSSSLVQAEGKQ